MFYCEEVVENVCASWVEVTDTSSSFLSVADAQSWLYAAIFVLSVAYGFRIILRILR